MADNRPDKHEGKLNYRDSGVDTREGEKAVSLMKAFAAQTCGPEVLTGIGGFASLYKPDIAGFRSPVLVAGCDGVGTKLRVAMMMDRFDTVGQDLVAMCVNDVLCAGARPLFFLDYIATGRLEAAGAADLVAGVARGCELAGCALVGGETAEMPGFYAGGDFDMAGFAVGIVDEEDIIDGRDVRAGDLLVGIPSSGLHSNGFSLVRKLFFEREGLDVSSVIPGLDQPLGEILLTPTRIYSEQVAAVLDKSAPLAIAHITGGGFIENIPRVIPSGLGVRIEQGSWDIPPIFNIVRDMSGMDEREIFNTLNMGIGMVMIVHSSDIQAVTDALARAGEAGARVVGEVINGGGVSFS